MTATGLMVLVEKGSIELQNTRFQEDMPVGGRHHLFKVLARGAVFGSKPEKASGWQGWMGIVSSETVVREMDFTGRPLKGFVYVGIQGFASDEDLESWIGRCNRFVRSLPSK